MAERSKARIYGRSLARIAGSNPAGGMDVCLLCVLYSKDKRHSQDNQYKEVEQVKYREREKNPTGDMDVCLLSVVCSLCDWPIPRPEESYGLWCVCVWSTSFENELALARLGCCARKRKSCIIMINITQNVVKVQARTPTLLHNCVKHVTSN